MALPQELGGTGGWETPFAVVGALPWVRCCAIWGFLTEQPSTISFSPLCMGTGTAACKGTWGKWGLGFPRESLPHNPPHSPPPCR